MSALALRIEYKLLSLTYKVLTTSQPDYLHNLISVQSTDRTRSSSLVTLARPSIFPHYESQLILRISPHHSHHFRSHHLSLPLPCTPDLKLISLTNPFFHSHSYSFRSDFMDLNLYWIKGTLALFYLMASCARLSCILSFRVHVKLHYRIVSCRCHCISRCPTETRLSTRH